MSIPDTVHNYLSEKNIPYETITLQPSKSSVQSATLPFGSPYRMNVLRDNRLSNNSNTYLEQAITKR